MRIAILSSEVVPFAKAGGLADVAGALPKALRKQGTEAIVILPLYDRVDPTLLGDTIIENVPVEWRGSVRPTRVHQSEASGAPAYLIEAPEYFHRYSIYGQGDDHERFAFFSRAALALLKHMDWQPEVLHANDWTTGFAVIELRARRRHDSFYQPIRSLFSIHNLAYQGSFDARDLWWLGFGDPFDRNDFMLDDRASALKAGLIAADALSTVSRRYAREIQTPEQGYGLDWLLRARSDRLAGITNGVDYEVWNPETDPHIASNFSADDLSGKRECKRDLLSKFGLPSDADRPLSRPSRAWCRRRVMT